MKKSSPMYKYREIGNRRHVRNKLMKSFEPICVEPLDYVDFITPAKQIPNVGNFLKILEHDETNPYSLETTDRIFDHPKINRKYISDKTDKSKLKTMVDDIHAEYFKVVEGRAIRPNIDIKVFIENLRLIFQQKADAGYLGDQYLKMDFQISLGELQEYYKIVKASDEVLKNFQMFLSYSFQLAHKYVEKAEKSAAKVAEIRNLYHQYNVQLYKLTSDMVTLADRIELMEKYHTFLLRLSPIWWRLKHNVGFMGKSVIAKKLFTVVESDSEGDGGEEGEERRSLFDSDEEFIENKKKDKITIIQGGSFDLYFKNPEELISALDDIAFRCGRYMVINQYNDRMIIQPLLRCRDALRKRLVSKDLEYYIKKYEMHTQYFEEREKELEAQFFKILYETFQNIINSFDYCKLYANLIYINKKVLNNMTTDKSDSIRDLMKAIEGEYFELMLAVECMDNDIVDEVIRECYLADRKMMRKAYVAQRELREWANFDKALRASFEPPRYRHKKR